MPQLSANGVVQKLRRIGAMPVRELAHRSREKAYAGFDRAHLRMAVRAPKPFKSYLIGGPADRFYCSHRQDLQGFVRQNFPEWIDKAVAEAERLCRHQIFLFGYGAVDVGSEIDWHRDPIAGRTWEQRFFADYRPVEQHGGLDAKVIHELNRHQHLPRLAKAYYLTGDERYAAEAVAQMLGWIEQNPPERGINWQCSLEIGIRAISWMWTIFLILPSRAFETTAAQRIGDSLFAQLEHVYRYLSIYTSPNTHLIGEAAALFIGGLVFGDQKRAAVWLRESAGLLADEAEKQIFDDGVYGELSSYYHCYAVDFYLQALILGDRNGHRFSRGVRTRVCAALQFLMHLTRPDGTIPALGDDDGGRALALDAKDYRGYLDGLCAGSILFRRGDFKYQAGGFFEEALWMFGLNGWMDWRNLLSEEPARKQVTYPNGGYAILRSRESHLVFDCGGMGILTGAHAHADALAVTLFHDGRELLADPGTYVYNGDPDIRKYFRSTAAHNTVTIDGQDQAEQGGTFRWTSRFTSTLGRDSEGRPKRLDMSVETADTSVCATSVEGYLEAEHDGYARLGVTHRRRIWWPGPGYWIIADDFRGSGEHRFDFHYNGGDIAFASSAGVSKVEQISRFASHRYGERHRIECRRVSVTAAAPFAAITLVPVPVSAGDVAQALLPAAPRLVSALLGRHETASAGAFEQLTLERGTGVACSYRHGNSLDIAVLSTSDSEISLAGLHMRGEFFWMRLEGGVLTQVLATHAYSLGQAGRSIFQQCEPGPFFKTFDSHTHADILCAEFAGS